MKDDIKKYPLNYAEDGNNKRFCPTCGAPVGESARFCMTCGANLSLATEINAVYAGPEFFESDPDHQKKIKQNITILYGGPRMMEGVYASPEPEMKAVYAAPKPKKLLKIIKGKLTK